jgi:ABC-type bacteriocin/lantibiotic exporter with double-glycine peptidase domain
MILLMADGRIIERGTHEQLMAAGAEYAAMVVRQMQQQQQDEAEARADTAPVI